MTRTLIVWGCTSHAGKSWLVTALCRAAVRRGVRVVPFKAQNMSNNARVVPGLAGEPAEIGSAQYLQALAARVDPGVDINPILLKPEHDTGSQVLVHGHPDRTLSPLPWRERSRRLAVAAEESFHRLAARHDLVIVEGAGSPAEINLAPEDYVNLGVARWAMNDGHARALLVSDIDRGGAFAHLYGTTQLLPDDLRPLLQGYVLNRFRGDPTLLAPGPQQLASRTGVPTVAVIPRIDDHGLPDEDGWFDDAPATARPTDDARDTFVARRRIVIIALPRISNLDEFAPLAQLDCVRVVWARAPAQLADADLVIIPGSKQVSGDLAWLRERGLDQRIIEHARTGGALLGICGGLQMLGMLLDDSEGHDGKPGISDGLALLPLSTRYAARKSLHLSRMTFGSLSGAWAALSTLELEGYEIHHGETTSTGAESGRAEPARPALRNRLGQIVGWQLGNVLGIYLHGMFESAAVQHALFGAIAPGLEATFDRLADIVEAGFADGVLDQWLTSV